MTADRKPDGRNFTDEDRKRFESLLDLFPADTQFMRDYVKRAKLRGWKTLVHLPRGTGMERLLDVGSMRGLYDPAVIEMWNYGSVSLLGDDLPTEGSIDAPGGGGRVHRLAVANCNIEAETWPLESESFDTVICTEVLEHMMFDPVFVMNEMCRVLKPGGFCLLTIPNTTSDGCLTKLVNGQQPGHLRSYCPDHLRTGRRDLQTASFMGHFHEYTRAELECLLSATGFESELMTGISPSPPPLDSLRFRFLKLLVRWLFPRARRIRGEHLLCLARKKQFVPLEQLPNRFPPPLYMEAKG